MGVYAKSWGVTGTAPRETELMGVDPKLRILRLLDGVWKEILLDGNW